MILACIIFNCLPIQELIYKEIISSHHLYRECGSEKRNKILFSAFGLYRRNENIATEVHGCIQLSTMENTQLRFGQVFALCPAQSGTEAKSLSKSMAQQMLLEGTE